MNSAKTMQPAFFKRSELAASLWSFRHQFMLAGALSFVVNLLMLAPTLYMLQVYDRVLSSRSELTLLAVSLITLFLFAITSLAEWARSQLLVQAGIRFDRLLGTRVFNASFETYLEGSATGSARAFADLIQIRQFLTGNGLFVLFDLPWTPIYILVEFLIHPMLGWTAIGFAVIQGLYAWYSHRRTSLPSKDAAGAASDVQAFLRTKLRNIEVVEAMGMLPHLRKRWAWWQDIANTKQAAAASMNGQSSAVSKFVRYLQQSASLAVGAVLVIQGQMSPGAMIACNVLMTRALAPIDGLVGSWRNFITAWAAFQRLEELLATYPERKAERRGVRVQGEFSLSGVVATAPQRVEPILRGIDLKIGAGTVLAVIGPSGSGKSTLARVLTGIWPHVTGPVLLDGQPVTEWDRHELGPQIGYLPQDIELFEGTIAENISRFGKLDAEKVIEAARIAGLHEMILRFPKGYDTPLSAGGGLLSGGQRQRVGLARAVYGDPSVLVLDEPNANLDEAGEAALSQALRLLKQRGKTVVLVTHRGTAVAMADRVLVLKEGRVVLEGERETVLAALRQPAPAPVAAPPSRVQPA